MSPTASWLLTAAVVLVAGHRPVFELLARVAGGLRRALARPEASVRRRDGVDLCEWAWPTPARVDADVPLTVPDWCAPREAGRTQSPRRAA